MSWSVDRDGFSLDVRIRQHAVDICGGEIDRPITGVARSTAGQPLGGHSVRVRSVRTGDVVATATTSATAALSSRICSGQLRGGNRQHRRKDCRHARNWQRRRGKRFVVDGHGGLDQLVGGIATALVVTLIAAGAVATTAIVVATTGDESSPSQ